MALKLPFNPCVTFLPNDCTVFPPGKVFLVDEASALEFFISCPNYFTAYVVNEKKMTIGLVDNFAAAIEFFRR